VWEHFGRAPQTQSKLQILASFGAPPLGKAPLQYNNRGNVWWLAEGFLQLLTTVVNDAP